MHFFAFIRFLSPTLSGEQHSSEKASCMQNMLAAFNQNALYAARPPWDGHHHHHMIFRILQGRKGGSEAIMIINAALPRRGRGVVLSKCSTSSGKTPKGQVF